MQEASPAVIGARKAEARLSFAFLVYQHGEKRWVARSILTGHLGHGAAAHEAVEALQRVLDVSTYVAREGGVPPSDWLRKQRPDLDAYAMEFLRLVAQGTPEETKSAVGRAGCVLEARIRQRAS